VEDFEPLIYVEPNLIRDEDINEEVDVDDVKVIKTFATLWKAELEEAEDGNQDHQVW